MDGGIWRSTNLRGLVDLVGSLLEYVLISVTKNMIGSLLKTTLAYSHNHVSGRPWKTTSI